MAVADRLTGGGIDSLESLLEPLHAETGLNMLMGLEFCKGLFQEDQEGIQSSLRAKVSSRQPVPVNIHQVFHPGMGHCQ